MNGKRFLDITGVSPVRECLEVDVFAQSEEWFYACVPRTGGTPVVRKYQFSTLNEKAP